MKGTFVLYLKLRKYALKVVNAFALARRAYMHFFTEEQIGDDGCERSSKQAKTTQSSLSKFIFRTFYFISIIIGVFDIVAV